MADKFCPNHGPYSATDGRCPYCKRESKVAASNANSEAMTQWGDASPKPPQPAIGQTHRPVSGGNSDQGNVTKIMDVEDTPDNEPLLAWLIVLSSPHIRRGHIWKIKSGSIWGRDVRKSDVVVDDENISGLHARIRLHNGKVQIIDLGSANGTYVNEVLIDVPQDLTENDVVRMGATKMILKTITE